MSGRPHTRAIDPPGARNLPATAAIPRALPLPNVFRRHFSTLVAYIVALAAAVVISAVGYAAYAFSSYQGVILPGVHVSTLDISGLTPSQAEYAIEYQLNAIHQTPVQFVYGSQVWKPSMPALGVSPDFVDTAANAYSIGRTGNFLQNLFDRLPVRRHFSVSLLYSPHDPSTWSAWVAKNLELPLDRAPINAWLAIDGSKAVVLPGAAGKQVNSARALAELSAGLGSLSTHRIEVPINADKPWISDAEAGLLARRVNAFLKKPPVLLIDGRRIKTDPVTLAAMISFGVRPIGVATLTPKFDPGQLRTYLYGLIGSFNQPVREPLYSYDAGKVSVIQTGHNGHRYSGPAALAAFGRYFMKLVPGRTIRVTSHVVKPPMQQTSPASLGVTTLLGEGSSNLAGSSTARASESQAIAAQLDGILIPPAKDFSFNQYVNQGQQGTGWPALDYDDAPALSQLGTPGVGPGGAMQQVATTFFRAAYAAGLPLLERHAHHFLLPWYSPPGMDAFVTAQGNDLRFRNTTGKYLLIQTRYEPIQQMLYIYVYGPKTGWKVNISAPKLTSTYASGPAVLQYDPNLAPGVRRLIRAAFTGYRYTITRTVSTTSPAGTRTDTLISVYASRPAIYLVGTKGKPKPTPTPTASPTLTATATPTPTPGD